MGGTCAAAKMQSGAWHAAVVVAASSMAGMCAGASRAGMLAADQTPAWQCCWQAPASQHLAVSCLAAGQLAPDWSKCLQPPHVAVCLQASKWPICLQPRNGGDLCSARAGARPTAWADGVCVTACVWLDTCVLLSRAAAEQHTCAVLACSTAVPCACARVMQPGVPMLPMC
jgi:hypothetical protein